MFYLVTIIATLTLNAHASNNCIKYQVAEAIIVDQFEKPYSAQNFEKVWIECVSYTGCPQDTLEMYATEDTQTKKEIM